MNVRTLEAIFQDSIYEDKKKKDIFEQTKKLGDLMYARLGIVFDFSFNNNGALHNKLFITVKSKKQTFGQVTPCVGFKAYNKMAKMIYGNKIHNITHHNHLDLIKVVDILDEK